MFMGTPGGTFQGYIPLGQVPLRPNLAIGLLTLVSTRSCHIPEPVVHLVMNKYVYTYKSGSTGVTGVLTHT